MKQWTDSARQVFDQYCERTRHSLAGSGADADEVIDDLRRHVDEEARLANLPIVTEEDMQRILKRVGEPVNGHEQPQPTLKSPHQSAPESKKKRRRPGWWLLILGVIFPSITIGFELATGASAGILFDPMPTWFHVALLALVPGINLWMWRAGRISSAKYAALLGWLNGAALGVCMWYALLYVVILPFSALAILYFGIGLIPLGPYFALLATPLIRRAYQSGVGLDHLPGLGKGALLSLALLISLQLPTALTYHGLSEASSDDPAISRAGVRLLRNFGDRDLMLRTCYGLQNWGAMDVDIIRNISSDTRYISEEQARTIYFRVTGQPFNAIRPPAFFTRNGRWSVMEDEYTWDGALGGETVAGQVKGLSLSSSRLDAIVEPDAAVTYTEWTLEFKNVWREQREARAQIALPPGGVVSRLTLWVNGEEREAAFAGRSEVRQAYQQVAVVRRRDPVLVTTCGPDRVLVQCFPVPPNGGTMKVRIGITAPLTLDSPDHGRFCWPRFIERNFAIADEFKHTLWIESPDKLTTTTETLKADHSKVNIFALHGLLDEHALGEAQGAVQVERAKDLASVWTPALEPDSVVTQSIRSSLLHAPSQVVLVVDGSVGMKDYARDVAKALEKLSDTMEVKVLVAGDEVIALNDGAQKATKEAVGALQQKLRSFRFAGGRNNLPALEQAWDDAAANPNGVVVWIHAAQPFALSGVDALRQRLERGAQSVRLIGLQAGVGPNRIAEQLDGLPGVEFAPRFDGLQGDLERLFAKWDGKTPTLELVRERTARTPEATTGKQVSRHLERLWARDESARLAHQRKRDAAAALAAKHQLVTPVSGAVVLETIQQYAENNLKPADPETVPMIPEPGTWALMALGGAGLLWQLKFRGYGRICERKRKECASQVPKDLNITSSGRDT